VPAAQVLDDLLACQNGLGDFVQHLSGRTIAQRHLGVGRLNAPARAAASHETFRAETDPTAVSRGLPPPGRLRRRIPRCWLFPQYPASGGALPPAPRSALA